MLTTLMLTVVIGLTFGCVCLYFIFIISRDLCKHNKRYDSITILNLCSIILFGMCSFASAAYIIPNDGYCLYLHHAQMNVCVIINGIWTFSWRFGWISVYLSFTKRMQLIFDNNPKYKTANFSYCMIYLFLFIWISLSVFSFILHITNDQYDDNYWLCLFIVAITSQLILLVLSLSLIGLYLKKLWSLNMDIMKTPKSVEQRRKVLKLMSKSAILTLFALLSSEISLLSFAIFTQWNESINIIRLSCIILILSQFDSFINSFCIYLSFDTNEVLYNSCCGAFQYFCTQWLKKYSKKQRRKKMMISSNSSNCVHLHQTPTNSTPINSAPISSPNSAITSTVVVV